MQNKNNKIIIAILVLLFIAIFAFLIYSLTNKTERIVEAEKPKPSFPILQTIYEAVTGGDSQNENNSTSTATSTVDFEELKYIQKIYDKPVAGYTLITKTIKAATSTEADKTIISAFIVDKATGYVYYGDSEDKFNMIQLSNTDFKNVISAEFSTDASVVAINYINENKVLETYIGRVPQTQNANLINKGIVTNVKNIKASTDSKYFIYQSVERGSSVVKLFDNALNTEQTLFSIPLEEINLSFVNPNQIIISTKPTYLDKQKTFIYDIKNRNLSMYTENNGSININNQSLMSVYSDGSKLLNNNGQNYSVRTLSDKCAFNNLGQYLVCGVPRSVPNLNYPDDWYKGRVSFEDNIYLLGPNSTYQDKILDLSKEVGEKVDAENLKVVEDVLLFSNKTRGGVFIMDLYPYLEGNSLGE